MNKEIQLPFGIRDGRLISINEINESERGLKCNCTCAHCGDRLIAKLGKIKVRHFTHSNSNCSGALESSLHIFAKQVLQENKKIKVPKLMVCSSYYDDYYYKNFWGNYNNKDEGSDNEVIVKEQIIEFDRVELETRIDNIVPDVVLYKGNKPLLVEIAVTHFIDNEKLLKIKQKDLSTIEIYFDLKELDKHSFDKAYVENLIINEIENKSWIYNSKANKRLNVALDKYKKYLEKDKLRREKLIEEQIKEEEKIRKEKELLLIKYFDELDKNKLWMQLSSMLRINKTRIPIFLNINSVGSFIFACDKSLWQTAIYCKFVKNRQGEKIKVIRVASWVISYSRIPLNRRLLGDFNQLEQLEPIIHSYLMELNNMVILSIVNSSRNISNCEFKVLLDDFEQIKNLHFKGIKRSGFEKIKENKKTKNFVSTANIIPNEVDKAEIEKIKLENREHEMREREEGYYREYEQRAKRNVKTKKNLCEDKNYTCRQCNENTNDWIIAYGDGTCICRKCNYK